MLQSLREHSGRWFFKVILVSIAGSFVLFGVSDMIKNYQNNRPVAIVGGQKISIDRYQHALRQEISSIQEKLKAALTDEDFKKYTIHKRVLDRLIKEAALDEEVHRNKIVVPDSFLKDQVKSISVFHEEGRFSKKKFDLFLRQRGLSEDAFLQDMHRRLLMQQFMGAFSAAPFLPDEYVRVVYKALHDIHVFSVVSIPYEGIVLKHEPTHEELQNLYSRGADRYAVSEARTVSFIILKAKSLLPRIHVPEEDIQQEYQKRKEAFSVPEERSFKKVTFPSKQLADDAYKLIQEGRLSLGNAKKQDIVGGNLEDMVGVEKEKLPKELNDIVFALDVGKHSQVIHHLNGYTLFFVYKADPARIKSYEEVKPEILENLRTAQLGSFIKDFSDKIEDQVASGGRLQDIAKDLTLPLEVRTFDKNGMDSGSKEVLKDLSPEVREVLMTQAASLSQGGINPVAELSPEESLIVQLDQITPSFVPSFEKLEVRVKKDWIDEERQKKANEIAQVLAKAKNKDEFVKLAEKNRVTLSTNQSLTRADFEESVSGKVKKSLPFLQKVSEELAFRSLQLAPNQVAIGGSPEGVAVVMYERGESVVTPPVPLDDLKKGLSQSFERDMIHTVMAGLKDMNKVDINEELLKQINGDKS